MATSAFKSTSRRTNSSATNPTTKPLESTKQQNGDQNSTQKGPLRRSRSVSAFSRIHLDINSDFLNKRDNPLFWVEGSPRSEAETGVKFSKFDDISSKLIDRNPKGYNGGGEIRRGRTVSRNSGGESKFSGGGRRYIGRSLSRVDTGRRQRSPSTGHYGAFESGSEQESGLPSSFRRQSKISLNGNCTLQKEKNKLVRSTSDLSEILKGQDTWSSQHPAFESSDDSAIRLSGSRRPHCERVRSTASFSDVEEKIVKLDSDDKKISLKDDNDTTGGILETVHAEVRRVISDMQTDLKNAMLRSNSDIVTSSVLSDIAPELANPEALELVWNIRGEYVRELEECEERTRKLRAELAVEEHREIELNKILKDIIPEPKTPQVRGPLAARKASSERRKMSKCLEEEAMAYFDECVSISTFDESDFSSLEDPPAVPSSANFACPFSSQDLTRQSPLVQYEGSCLPANSSCNDSSHSSPNSLKIKPQFAFTPKPSSGTASLEQEIRKYVKILPKDNGSSSSSNSQFISDGHRNTDDYTSQVPTEKFLLDRMTFRNRIESGSMLLCGGGFAFSAVSCSSVLW